MSNQFISLETAVEMITLYRSEREAILLPEMRGKDILFFSESFERSTFDTLLAEPGAAGLRFYLGMTPNLWVRLIAVATDSNGNDILPAAGTAFVATGDPGGGNIAEQGIRCPTNCPTGGGLGGGNP